MHFSPTEAQTMLTKSVGDLLRKQYDLKRRREIIEARPAQYDGFWRQLAELGVLGIEIGEAFGGSGAEFEDLCAVMEPFGAALVVQPFIACVVMAVFLLNEAGTPAQQAAYLPRIADGSLKLAFAHASWGPRPMLNWVAATAVAAPGGYRIDAANTVVLGGDEAECFIVSARATGETGTRDGISLFLVPSDLPGVQVRRYAIYDGTGGADLTLTDVFVPEDALLGSAGAATPLIEAAHDRATAAICVEAVGAMQRLCDITVDYLKTREQFGQKIGKFQVLQHRAVDMLVALELARSMALVAVDAISRSSDRERGRLVSAAKTVIGKSARTVGQSAVQLHGGIALTEEYSAGHYFKRLTAIERLFGDAAYHTERFHRFTDA